MKAHLIGGGIGSLAAAAFMVRDGGVPGGDITIYEKLSILGGSLDGARQPDGAYVVRGGRMLTFGHYECTWDLFDMIPSLEHPGKTVRQDTEAFNEEFQSYSQARLVDRNRHKVDVSKMGFTMSDRAELLALTEASEEALGADRITDWLSPAFFENNFWHLWQTTFAFQPWHSAVELKRYLHRFMNEFPRIDTLAGVRRTVYNQYDAMVRPLAVWLGKQGVQFISGAEVVDIGVVEEGGLVRVNELKVSKGADLTTVAIAEDDLVFLQNASMTDASSLGSMTTPPQHLTKADSQGWALWEKLAKGRPEFGNPAAFNSSIPESWWEILHRDLLNDDLLRPDGGIQRQCRRNWRPCDIQGFELAHVRGALPPAAFSWPTGQSAGFLGICLAPRPYRQFRRQADDRLHRRGNPR